MKPFIEDGSLVMLGVIQEQHADRCQLFKQWKQLDFPVVQDQLNTNGINVVPVYVAIDEHGIVRGKPRNSRTFEAEFLKKAFDAPKSTPAIANVDDANLDRWTKKLESSRSVDNLIGAADAMILWKPNQEKVASAIKLYQEAVELTDKSAANAKQKRSDLRFRLGAANRLLYEQQGQTDSDLFFKSVDAWETSLRMNPNQYIYRRRIEQYGPRLKKPYSFYDWVSQARDGLKERGEDPIKLAIEPNGAELAQRARTMKVDTSATNPDPEATITLDEGQLVNVHANVVPTKPNPGDVVAVHLGFHLTKQAKWNHETEALKVWIDVPDNGVTVSSKLIVDETPYASAESQQPISISLEAKIPKEHKGPIKLSGYALFNICETANGQCVYRRRNFTVVIK